VCGLKSVDIKGMGMVGSFDSTLGCYGCPLLGGGTNVGNQAHVVSDRSVAIQSGSFMHGKVTFTLESVAIMSGATVDEDVTAGTTVTNKGFNGTITQHALGLLVVCRPIPPCAPLTAAPRLSGLRGSYTYDSKGNLTVNGS